jgi:hypothetical protein
MGCVADVSLPYWRSSNFYLILSCLYIILFIDEKRSSIQMDSIMHPRADQVTKVQYAG